MTKYFFIYAYVQYVCSNYCRVNYSSLNHDGNEHVLVLLWCIKNVAGSKSFSHFSTVRRCSFGVDKNVTTLLW